MFDLSYRPPSVDVKFRPRRSRRRLVLGLVAAAAAALLAAFAYLWQNVFILELNYKVVHGKRELDDAYQENVLLKAELYRRRSIAQLDAVAHDELGMHAPAPGQITIIEERR